MLKCKKVTTQQIDICSKLTAKQQISPTWENAANGGGDHPINV